MAMLPPLVTDYSIIPFVKTELLLLVRKGSKWFWLINGGLWISMIFVSLSITEAYLLPMLLFLQITRWSELTTKEQTNRLHYFTWSSYKPLLRMLPAQLLAGFVLALTLALPVICRQLIAGNLLAVINIINGTLLIILLAACLGILTGSKKLFEILFFFITYLVIEQLPVADYLGTMPHGALTGFTMVVLLLNVLLGIVSFLVRSYQVRHL